MNGLFVAPFHRLLDATAPLPPLTAELPGLLLSLLLVQLLLASARIKLLLSFLLVALSVALLLRSRSSSLAYLLILDTFRGSIPLLALATVAVLAFRSDPDLKHSAHTDQLLVLLLCVTAMCSLVQFPFGVDIYFCYVAPLAILLAAALISRLPNLPRAFLWSSVGVSVLFAVFVFRPTFLYDMGKRYQPDLETVPLNLPRAENLRVTRQNAADYQRLIPFVRSLAAGRPIVAGPDCPEVYFLTGAKNPTPFLFDFLHDLDDYRETMESLLADPNLISVVVLKENPDFSFYQLKVLQAATRDRFPASRKIGTFRVYWRP
jgi:hypothetical protein